MTGNGESSIRGDPDMGTKRVGFFRELKHGDPDGPVLAEAVRNEPGPDERDLVAYLRGATVLAGAPGLADDALDTSKTQVSPFHICTDGTWMWPLDLAYYVE